MFYWYSLLSYIFSVLNKNRQNFLFKKSYSRKYGAKFLLISFLICCWLLNQSCLCLITFLLPVNRFAASTKIAEVGSEHLLKFLFSCIFKSFPRRQGEVDIFKYIEYKIGRGLIRPRFGDAERIPGNVFKAQAPAANELDRNSWANKLQCLLETKDVSEAPLVLFLAEYRCCGN